MSELSYPVDKISSLPYPVIPYENSDFVDTNHVAFHGGDPLLQGDGGRAVRYARVQEMDRGVHETLHERYKSMACLPETPDEQFEYCVWASLGDIPPYAVDLSRRRHWISRLDNNQINTLRSRDIRIGSNQVLASFFTKFILEQTLQSVDGYSIDKYLYTPFRKPRAHKGEWLIREAVADAVAPLQKKYRTLRREGRIAVSQQVTLQELVLSKIGKYKREEFVKRKRLERMAVTDLARLSLRSMETEEQEILRQAA